MVLMDNNILTDRIGRLKEWEQTDALNEMLFNALSSLNAYTEERFDELSAAIKSESAPRGEAPVIKVAVCAEEDADKQLFLYPVASEPPIKSPDYITTVFLECDYPAIQELMRHTFTAEVKCKTGTIQTQVALRYSLKYLQKLESLYYVFGENELPWTTVNGIYFYKFLDVYCANDTEISGVSGFDIDFAGYERYVSYDKTLLWNINPLTAPVAACEPKPAYNAVQFEHALKNLQLDDHQYLVCPIGDKFTCFRRGQVMYVRTYAKQLEQIELLRIVGGEDADIPLYLPPKSNQKKYGFIDSLAGGRYIPTRGEAERIIHSLHEEVNLRLVDIKVIPRTKENILKYKGIDYNSFIESYTLLTDRKLLLFSFDTGENAMWAHEKMFFVLSELQLYFYEYRCVGEIL